VYNAILSRSTVFEFKQLDANQVRPAVERAVRIAAQEAGVRAEYPDELIAHIAAACGGDVRKAINAVELLFAATPEKDGVVTLRLEDAREVSQRSAMRYDRQGDSHYDILSAFQKSIRGSDPDAAVHYLARLLEAGDLPSACRRLLVCAAEDIGLAYPQAVTIAKSCVDIALQVGLPEAQLPLAEAVILLATAPKSNSAANAIGAAMSDIANGKNGDIPNHLKDAHYSGAGKLGRGIEYKYPHSYPNHYIKQQYLPDTIKDARYYEYGPNKVEQASKKYWEEIKKDGEA
jgi:putative ATPase